MANILLLISTHAEDRAFAEQVAAAAELSVVIAASPAEAARIIDEQEPRAIFADIATQDHHARLESAIQERVGLFSDKINANTIHFLSSEPLDKSRYLIGSPLFGSFILRKFGAGGDLGKHYGRIVRATGQSAEDTFGLEQLLDPAAKIQTVKLKSSSQKPNAVEAIKNYFLAARFQPRMAGAVASAVDEMLMNAMFDAPVNELGRPLHANTLRSTAIKLEGKSAIEMNVGFDGTYGAISVIDHYGSLDKIRLLSHLSKAYTDEEYTARATTVGAGIGLSMVFRSGGSLLFSSEAQIRTEVAVLFRKTENFRDFRGQLQFISTCFRF